MGTLNTMAAMTATTNPYVHCLSLPLSLLWRTEGLSNFHMFAPGHNLQWMRQPDTYGSHAELSRCITTTVIAIAAIAAVATAVDLP